MGGKENGRCSIATSPRELCRVGGPGEAGSRRTEGQGELGHGESGNVGGENFGILLYL